MFRRRERVPYEWCVAVAAIVALALIPWVPLTPLSGVVGDWVRWFVKSVLGGGTFVCASGSDAFLRMFLPFIGAALLAWPLAVLAVRLQPKRRSMVWAGAAAATLLVGLAALETAEAIAVTGSGWAIGRIALTCGVGLSLASLGAGFRQVQPSADRVMMALSITLMVSGLCVASFVLLPVGLLGWIVVYILATGLLLRRERSDGDVAVNGPAAASNGGGS